MREINKIIIHCSDSKWGDSAVIDKWHKQRGWDGIGYHYVILNGSRETSKVYNNKDDGKVEIGRDINTRGAHCYGENSKSAGICLIGKRTFTAKQLYSGLPDLINALMDTYELGLDDIYGHNDFNKAKTCPNFDVEILKKLL